MELAFLTLLLKNGAKSVSGGVAINNEGFLKTRLSENRGGANGVNQGLKGGFVLIFPVEFATFSAKCDECVERGGQEAEIPDIHVVEIEEAQEGVQLPEGRGSFPILDTINFDQVHGDLIFTDDDA